MRYSVHGFNQQAASLIRKTIIDKDGKEKTLKIDVKDLTILQWLMDYSSSGKMPSIEIKATKYYHVSYNKLFADNPCLDCNQRTAFEKLQKLVELNLLKYHYDITVKPQSFYAINEKCFELLNDDTPEDIHNLVNNSQFTQLAKNDTTLQKLHDLAKNGTVKQKTVPSSKICNYPSPLNIDNAPAPAKDNIYNNNICLSLSEKEEINKKHINRYNISSFGSFLLKNCDDSEKSENACPDGQKAISQNSGGIQNANDDFDGDMEDDEESAEAFLNECKAIFKENPEKADNSITDVDIGSCPDDDPFGMEVDIQKTVPLQEMQGIDNNTLNLRFDEKTVSSSGNDDKASKNTTSEKSTAKKNNTTDSNTCMTFDEFWYMYGKKVEMKKCCQLYSKIKEADRQKIKDTLPKYVEATPDTQFRKYPATYLRNECWNDDLSAYQGTGFSNGRNNRDELKSEWADRVLGKVITKKASPETIEYFKHLDGPFGQLKTEN